jgi:hypothetical protein
VSKYIEVEAVPREGHGSRWRADREFKAGEPVRLEVLDQDEDHIKGWTADHQPIFDDATTVEAEVTNHSTGKVTKTRRPHPTKIGRKGYEQIKADPVLRIREGGDLETKVSREAMDAARKQASELGAKLTDAHAELAEVKAENAKLKARIAELEGKGGPARAEGGGEPGAPSALAGGEESKGSANTGKGSKK